MKTVLFDMYGVLLRHGDSEAMRQLIATTGALDAGVTVDQFQTAWRDNRTDIDAGRISQQEFWQRMSTTLDVPLDGEAFDRAEPQVAGHPDFDMINYALGVRTSGVQVGILSNIPHYMVRDCYAHWDWLNDFDVRIYSCDTGFAKPEQGIYEYAVRTLDTVAEHILFLDDVEANVVGARQVGMRAFRHDNLDESAQRVDAFVASSH